MIISLSSFSSMDPTISFTTWEEEHCTASPLDSLLLFFGSVNLHKTEDTVLGNFFFEDYHIPIFVFKREVGGEILNEILKLFELIFR